MKRILLSSVAIVSLLAGSQMVSAQVTAPAPTSDRPSSEAPADKKPAAPKAQTQKKEETTSPSRTGAGAEPDPKSAPAKASPKSAGDTTKDAPAKAGASTSTQQPATATNPDPKTTAPASATGTSTTSSPTAPPAAGTASSKSGQPASQQNAVTTAPGAPAVAPEKAAKINEVIAREKVEAVTNVNFSVSVGVNIPSTVTVRPLPKSIVEIVPQYRGYDYVVVRDEIVIIEPRTRKIVTVINRGGGSATSTRSSTRISLAPERRRTIKQTLVKTGSPRPARTSARLVVGAEVPKTYEVREFPVEILQESPELRDYEYVLDEDNVVVVDRRERRVIEILD